MMRLALALIIIAMAVCVMGEDKPSIMIDMETNVVADQFTLGDIAAISASPDVTEQLSKIILGMSPRPGLKRQYTLSQIETRLKQHGFNPKDFKIIAPNTFVILRAGQDVSLDDLISTARDRIREQYGDIADRMTIQYPPKPTPINLGEFTLSADPVVQKSGNIYNVNVNIRQNDKTVVSYRISMKDNPTKAEILVKSGSVVSVLFNIGSLKLSADGTARSNGAMGETVTVVITATKKTAKAVVIGNSQVKLIE